MNEESLRNDDETDVEMWEREDAKRERAMKAAYLFLSWSAGWLFRQTVKGAAMALGGWLMLHLMGVV